MAIEEKALRMPKQIKPGDTLGVIAPSMPVKPEEKEKLTAYLQDAGYRVKLGKTVRSSVESGFNRALSAVIDSNVTTIISAVILWWLGTGTIKGFGMTLLMGVIVSMFSAIFVTKFLLKQMIGMNVRNNWLYGVSKKKTGSESVKGGEA